MQKLLEISKTGLTSILLYPLRSLVTTIAVMTVLVPFLIGLAISKGIQGQAEDAIRFGADLYVTGKQLGRRVPIPITVAGQIEGIEGVTGIVPRITGGIVLGKYRENAVVVGISPEKLPTTIACIEGRIYQRGDLNELVVGTELARKLKLSVGARIPPFYRNRTGERVSQIVGIFKSDVSIWQANLIFTSFETASRIYNQRGLATDLLVYCRLGHQTSVKAAILDKISFATGTSDGEVTTEVLTKEDLEAILPKGLLHREGIFNLHFLLAFVLGILVILVTSGFGLTERRREIGILKAIGWQTDEILLRSSVESLVICLIGASISLILSFVWLKWLNGYGVASVFLTGTGAAPSFEVPFKLTPIPALLAFLISLVVVMTGSLYTSWRAATVPPMEAMG